MKRTSFILISLIMFSTILYAQSNHSLAYVDMTYQHEEGFVHDTLIKVADGYKAIQELSVGDNIIGYDPENKTYYQDRVTHILEQTVPYSITIVTDTNTIQAAPYQKFYILSSKQWVNACDLSVGDALCIRDNNSSIITQILQAVSEIPVYALTVERHHLCITAEDLLAHNFVGVIALASTAAAPAVTATTIATAQAIASTAAAAGFCFMLKEGFCQLFGKKRNNRDRNDGWYYIDPSATLHDSGSCMSSVGSVPLNCAQPTPPQLQQQYFKHPNIKRDSEVDWNTVIDECKIHAEHVKKYQQSNLNRINQRFSVLNQVKSGEIYAQEIYALSSYAVSELKRIGCDASLYTEFYGNQLQRFIHQDCLNIVREVVLLPSHLAIDQYADAILMCNESARAYNAAQYVEAAIAITDFCWAAINFGKSLVVKTSEFLIDATVDIISRPEEYARSIKEGFALGMSGALLECIKHPIITVATVVAGRAVLAYTIGKIIGNICGIGVTYIRDPEEGSRQWNEYIVPAIFLISILRNQEVSGPDVVRNITQFGTQWYAYGKLLQGLQCIYAAAYQDVIAFVDRNKLAREKEYMLTPEGIRFNVSSSNDLPGGSDRPPVIRVGNMYKFFETEFGQLLKKNSTRLNQTYQGQTIYRVNKKMGEYLKKGYHYYLDNAHKNHLELFDSNLKSAGVLNLDGTKNMNKSFLSRNRTISL